MPVSFFIDPKIVEDRDTAQLSNLTLSYVFYPVDRTADAAGATGAAKDELRFAPGFVRTGRGT